MIASRMEEEGCQMYRVVIITFMNKFSYIFTRSSAVDGYHRDQCRNIIEPLQQKIRHGCIESCPCCVDRN